MDRALDRVSIEGTVFLLVAGFLLIGASLVDVGATVPLAAVSLLLTIALFAARDYVPPIGTVAGRDLRGVLTDSWIATALAATTTAVALGATPGELQSLGGLLGLVAMANYFLRPVYFAVYALLASAVERTHPENG